uniref:hypothetical protein n=1 Tax=Sulfuriferula sp. GW6 TaxID=3345112 RepID=UPI0039F70AA2
MKLKFTRAVRESFAGELKKVSTFGGLGIGVLGYSANSPAILLGACGWWAVCQIAAHVLMSIQDVD